MLFDIIVSDVCIWHVLVFSMCVSSLQSEKLLLFDTVQSELEEKIRRLEEERHSIDITSGNTHDTHSHIMFGHLCARHKLDIIYNLLYDVPLVQHIYCMHQNLYLSVCLSLRTVE